MVAEVKRSPCLNIDWEDEDEVFGLTEGLSDESEEHNSRRWMECERNAAWYKGHQDLLYSKARRCLVRYGNPWGRVRLMLNLLAAFVDGFVARVAQDKIRMVSRPATDDIHDRDVAELQTSVLRYYDDFLDIPRLVDQADLAAVLHGEVFLKVLWDPTAGSEFDVQPHDLDMDSETFRRRYGKALMKMRMGDLRLVLVPTYNIHWGPSHSDFRDAEYVLEEYDRSLPYVMEQYGLSEKDRDEVLAKSPDGRIMRYGDTERTGKYDYDQSPDTVRVRILWVKQRTQVKGLELGRHIITLGGKLWKNSHNPYWHRQIPILGLDLRSIPTDTHGDTWVSDMIPVQSDINRGLSQWAENRELMGNPVYLARPGSIVEPNEWNSNIGGVRHYQGSEAPQVQPGTAMPAAYLHMIDRLINQMQHIAGLRDPSIGRNPPGVRSGIHADMLREGDDERISRYALRRRRFWGEVGRMMLRTLRQFIREDRIVRIGGEDETAITMMYLGDMLEGTNKAAGVDYYDVRIEGNGLPQSMSARLQHIQILGQIGMLDPQNPHHQRIAFESLDLGESRVRVDPKANPRKVQHLRNRMMSSGQFEPPAMHEDLEEMHDELSRYRLRVSFRQLPQQHKQLFDLYEQMLIGLMATRGPRTQAIVMGALSRFEQETGIPLAQLMGGGAPQEDGQGAPTG